MKKITNETLKKWNACYPGMRRFNELFPEGELLRNASEALINDGNNDWSNWLWSQCKQDNEYIDQTIATAGDDGTATAGDDGTATAGDRGTATAGYRGTATAGDDGTATAGDRGTATAGDRGTATAGYRGTATAGDDGCISILYYDGQKYKRKIGVIGEGELKPNIEYIVVDGEFKEKNK